MKRCFQVALLLVPLLAAQPLPPLIDRELLFGSPEITGAQISPDGKYVTFLKPWKGTLNVWIKKTGEPFSAARPLTAEAKNAVSGYLWTRDGKYVCYVKDRGRREFQPLRRGPFRGARPRGRRSTLPRSDRPQGRGHPTVLRLPERPRPGLRRHQRPRQSLARSLQGEGLDRRQNSAPREYRADLSPGSSIERPVAPGPPHRG